MITNIRNPTWTADGRIDCEVEHQIYGWLPFTADQNDPEPSGAAVYTLAEAMNPSPYVPPPPPDPEIVKAQARATMQLTKRQLLIGLAGAGFISAAEAVAWAAQNTLPAAIEAMVVALPTSLEQTAARITLASFTVAYRLDPFVAMLAAVAPVPLDDAALDAFFVGYASV